MSSLRSQKIFKDVQLFLASTTTHHHQQNETTTTAAINDENNTENSGGTLKAARRSSKKGGGATKKRSNSSSNRSNNENNNNIELTAKSTLNLSATSFLYSSTICQDFIQNRLYLNKSMMNSIEPLIQPIKLQQLIASLYEKIEADKEILLVYTHLKREEKHLNTLEPLQPLFRRYSLGFERVIQIWRKKCSADSLLLANNNTNNMNIGSESHNLMQSSSISTMHHHRPLMSQSTTTLLGPLANQLYVINSDESAQIDRLQSSFESTVSPLLTQSQQQAVASCVSFLNSDYLTNPINDNDTMVSQCLTTKQQQQQQQQQQQKFHSELNLYKNTHMSNYSTLPAKLKKIPFIEDAQQEQEQEVEEGLYLILI